MSGDTVYILLPVFFYPLREFEAVKQIFSLNMQNNRDGTVSFDWITSISVFPRTMMEG